MSNLLWLPRWIDADNENQAVRMFNQFNPFSPQGDASAGQLDYIKTSAKTIREASDIVFQERSKEASKASLEGQGEIKQQVESFQSLFLENKQQQDALFQSVVDNLEQTKSMVADTKALVGENKVMLEQLVQESGLKTPYDADRARYALNRKMLEPQDEYLNNAYALKEKIHNQRP